MAAVVGGIRISCATSFLIKERGGVVVQVKLCVRSWVLLVERQTLFKQQLMWRYHVDRKMQHLGHACHLSAQQAGTLTLEPTEIVGTLFDKGTNHNNTQTTVNSSNGKKNQQLGVCSLQTAVIRDREDQHVGRPFTANPRNHTPCPERRVKRCCLKGGGPSTPERLPCHPRPRAQ